MDIDSPNLGRKYRTYLALFEDDAFYTLEGTSTFQLINEMHWYNFPKDKRPIIRR